MKRSREKDASNDDTELEAECKDASKEKTPTIMLFWKDLRRLLPKYKELWDEVDTEDVYKCRNLCDIEDCWYKRNLDRLDGLEIYQFCDSRICDVCWENDCTSEVLPGKDEESDDDVCEFELNINDIRNDKLKKKLLSLEVKENCDECDTYYYYEERDRTYWEACSECKCELYDENQEIDEEHIKCGKYEIILLCDRCIMHGGGLAHS